MRKGRWIGTLLLGLAVAAAFGLGVSAILFSRWSDLETIPPEQAEQAFVDAMAGMGDEPPYIEIARSGAVTVRRELERPGAAPLETLHLLAWDPERTRLLRIAFPFWFVRVKMNDTINLGTLTTLLAQDWNNIDLRVSEEDLARRGPGLVLDHRLASGARILLWTE